MLEIDVVDEAIIDGDPSVVRKALIDEAAGRSHWWLPYWQARPHGETPPDRVGGMFDVIVRKGITVRFTARVEEMTEKHLRLEYVAGAYRGEGTWSLEPVDGKTRLRFRWRVRPMGWLGWLLRLSPSSQRKGGAHREVMKAGFAGLNRYLNAQRAQTREGSE